MSKKQIYYAIEGFDGQYTRETKDLFECLTAGIPDRIQFVSDYNNKRENLFMSLLALRSKLADEGANYVSLNELEEAWQKSSLEHFKMLLEKMGLAPIYPANMQYILYCIKANGWTVKGLWEVWWNRKNGRRIEAIVSIPYKCFVEEYNLMNAAVNQ